MQKRNERDFPEKPVRNYFLLMCFFLPIMLLIAAYIKMVFFYQKLWLFNSIVHENGKYTLMEVVFYFSHFNWEMLGKTVYALLLVGVFYYYGNNPIREYEKTTIVPQSRIILSGMIVFSIVLLTLITTINKLGINEAMLGFLQYRTSEIKPIAFGSHWRNHFLSNIVLFSASAFMILLYRVTCCGGWKKRKFSYLFYISWGIFIVLTIFFGFTRDPFETPSYLGHQLREIFGSDLSITMPLAVSVLIFLEQKYEPGSRITTDNGLKQHNFILYLMGWMIPVVSISAFVVFRVLTLDISGEMSKLPGTRHWSVLDVFAWHFYEHSLDYVFVISLVYFLYLLTLSIESIREKK